jgi:hypothetical protein
VSKNKNLVGAPKEKVPKPVKTLGTDHRAVIDPEVRKVHAMRLQVQEAGEKLDTMLALVFPAWNKGEHIYLPSTGGFYKKATRLKKSTDPIEQPMKAGKR